MNRFDRALALLLLLRSGKTLSATTLARRFEVSSRTIYRDIDTLAAVGVPVYAEKGRDGGFRLLEGYFLPPITFSPGEAVSLLTGLALLGRLRVRPFPTDLAAAAEKLLAALPEHLRAPLSQLERIIAFEPLPHDSFHPDPADDTADPQRQAAEANTLTTFLQCILDGHTISLDYQAPFRRPTSHTLAPDGLLWDRDRWYLVAHRAGRDESPGVWRADRVQAIAKGPAQQARVADLAPAFDISRLLGRRWLAEAMADWAIHSPFVVRMQPEQAERLKRDWYYGHGRFEDTGAGQVIMTIGESDRSLGFALLRWLGPGAELLEPHAWRAPFAAQLRAQLAPYNPS